MSETENAFGRWLSQRRDQLNLSQRALGEKVGVSGEMIRQYENGAKPGSDKLSALAHALDSSEQHLTSLLGGKIPAAESGNGSRSFAPVKSETSHEVQQKRHHVLGGLSDEELAERDLYRVRQLTVKAGSEAEVAFLDEAGNEEILTGQYIRRKYSVEPDRLAEVIVRGGSMNGDPANISPGSTLKVMLTGPDTAIQHDAVYVIHGPSGLQIKRIRFENVEQEDGSVERYIWLWSDNEEAGRDRLPLDVWKRDYQVVALALTVENDL